MRSRGWGALFALGAIVAVSAAYVLLYVRTGALPAASGLLGHGIGVLGIVLMLMTESLYTIRKRLKDARWGSMAAWLDFHIATGLVGPYLVLLHTGMRFNGVAGIATLLTAVVVASGVVGRYLYTTVPRTVALPTLTLPLRPPEGITAEAGVSTATRGAWATWYSVHVPLTWALFAVSLVHVLAALYYGTLQR